MDNLTAPQIIYLAAGHIEHGGTQAHGLSEGRENIQVVDDAVRLLVAAGMQPAAAGRYRLREVEVVVVPHELDLVATVAWINQDFQRYDRGLCIEVHFNGPSPTAQGPMVIYDALYAPSVALADRAAPILAAELNLPCRRWTNQDNMRTRGWPYFFIIETLPLALIIECDELHNAARAAIIGDSVLDDVYGAAVAAVVENLVGGPSLAAQVADLQRRVAALEAAAQAFLMPGGIVVPEWT